jgi:hypothetical protein
MRSRKSLDHWEREYRVADSPLKNYADAVRFSRDGAQSRRRKPRDEIEYPSRAAKFRDTTWYYTAVRQSDAR